MLTSLVSSLLAGAVLCGTAAAAAPPVHPMHNGGTPGNIPPKTDCNIREFMWESGKKLMPRRGSFKTLYDALQLSACGVEGPAANDTWAPPSYPIIAGASALYVSAGAGSDSAAGSAAAPFKTIGHAIAVATSKGKATIVLRAGVYHGCDGKGNVCNLGAAQSGLTIQNAGGEQVVITGGEPLAIAPSMWKRYAPTKPSGPTQWKEMKNMNDVGNRAGTPTPASDTKCCKYLGLADSLKGCEALAESNSTAWAGVTYHTAAYVGIYAKHCYGVVAGDWIKPTPQNNIDSAINTSATTAAVPIYVADLNSLPGGKPVRRNMEWQDGRQILMPMLQRV